MGETQLYHLFTSSCHASGFWEVSLGEQFLKNKFFFQFHSQVLVCYNAQIPKKSPNL